VSQFLSTYGLWILLGLIFVALFLFGFSACRINHPPALHPGEGKAGKKKVEP